MKKITHIAITDSALDLMLMRGLHSEVNWPQADEHAGLFSAHLDEATLAFFSSHEPERPYVALINIEALKSLTDEAGNYSLDIYRRIARVLMGMKNPPIHLPRQWSEYHHKNLVSFFALSKGASGYRWIAETDGNTRWVRFSVLTSNTSQVDLADFVPSPWPTSRLDTLKELTELRKTPPVRQGDQNESLSQEVDLQVIGSGSVVKNRTFEGWQEFLSESQRKIMNQPINASVRIVGPAGSGKTLALCLRAIQIARDNSVASKGKKVLIATHSWAMAERIDGILSVLNGGTSIEEITVFPLLSLLQMHAGHIGQHRTDVIGDDSTDGRVKSIAIIKEIISVDRHERKNVSLWISEALGSPEDSRARLDLLFNLYEEISGVLTASSVALDDSESIHKYLNGEREDWMPPFVSLADRRFVIGVYKEFLRALVDRASITTDQFVLDSTRVLETFTWRMRKETDGYDFILIDELQLFDSQERSALELLGRSRKGVPFITAEDPSQGVFSSLHSKRSMLTGPNSVYLDVIHRFDKEIFELIKFIYQKFPLNTLPLRVDTPKANCAEIPKLHLCKGDAEAVETASSLAERLFANTSTLHNERICLATLGDIDADIFAALELRKLPVVQLASFDDVEQLSYSKRSLIVAPWQFVGGTQFSHVIVVAAAMSPAETAFGKLRELTAVYLSCSRAAKSLDIVCGSYMPQIVREAKDHGLISEAESCS